MDSTTRWVFCSGLMRSGSTLQYQIAKTLVEASGRGVGLGFCEERDWPRLLRERGAERGIHVIKTHRYLPGAGWLLRTGRAKSIFGYRDLRDVCVSRMNKAGHSFEEVMREGFLDDLLEDDLLWSTLPNTMTSVYEDVLEDLEAEVVRIASFLEIPLEADEARQVAETHSLSVQKRRIDTFDFEEAGVKEGEVSIYDPGTLLHHNHIHSGAPRQWERELAPQQVARLEEHVGDWLQRHGYDTSSTDAAAPAIPWRDRVRLRLRRLRSDLRIRVHLPAFRLRLAAWRLLRRLASVRVVRLLGRPLYATLGRRRSAARELGVARRILVIRLDRVGDVLLTLPLLRELRRNAPRAELTVVVRPEARELVADAPYVDRVLSLDPDVRGRFRELARHRQALALAGRHLWLRRPDLAILPRLDADMDHATFLAYFSGAGRRVGYSEDVNEHKVARNEGYDRLLTHVLEAAGVKHEVERNLDVVRELGGTVEDDRLELSLSAAARASAAATFSLHELDRAHRVVALGLGAGEPKRRWPVERFVEVAQWLTSELKARVLLVGGPGEEALGEAAEAALAGRAVNLVGGTTLPEVGALLERTDLFIGNDTGIMHLAAAVGTPVVVVSCHPRTAPAEHPNAPERFGPWGVASRVLQPDTPAPPCVGGCEAEEAHCITGVAVAAVREASAVLLTSAGTGRRAPGSPASRSSSLHSGARR